MAKRISWALVFAIILVVCTIWIRFVGWSNVPWQTIGWAVGSLLFGMLVAFSEILSRYRDEPIRACITPGGELYLLLNGGVSLAAFWLLLRYPAIFPSAKDDPFLTAVIAGFGAVTVFRAKLFTFRASDGKDYPIGPAIVLETVLKTLDQKIDRKMATERQARVFEKMHDLTDFDNTAKYLQASLNSFQNLTPEQKADINGVIEEYQSPKTAGWPGPLKLMALGFAFLNIAGDENFDIVIKNLMEFLTGLNPPAATGSPSASPAKASGPTPPPATATPPTSSPATANTPPPAAPRPPIP